MRHRRSAFLLRVAALCLLLSAGARISLATEAAVNPSDGPFPVPSLTPDEVVRIQLSALRDNDESDRGIAITFRFASPSNKAQTGPLSRFAQMIKAGPYRLMLEFRDAEYDPVEIVEDMARQRVTLTGPTYAVTFAFYLSKQVHAECRGCWMTDAVTVERVDANSA